MNETKQSVPHEGTFLEIIRINNGYAVYDFSVRQYDLANDRKAIPLVVFNQKEDMLSWIREDWKPKIFDPVRP